MRKGTVSVSAYSVAGHRAFPRAQARFHDSMQVIFEGQSQMSNEYFVMASRIPHVGLGAPISAAAVGTIQRRGEAGALSGCWAREGPPQRPSARLLPASPRGTATYGERTYAPSAMPDQYGCAGPRG
jgi:hypothetical protein